METVTISCLFPLTGPNPRQLAFPLGSSRINRFASVTKAQVSIRSPPLGFDYRTLMTEESRSAVATAHPELMDLVEAGRLVLVEKKQFGPVPEWRWEFVEPEAIWLVGTSHVSQKSVADVERVIRALRPDNVVVELCRSRAGIMYASKGADDAPLLKANMFSLGGTEFFGAVSRSIKLGGQSALALRLLLAGFSSKILLGVKRSFGDEFRAARKTSEEVGAQIVLGDRPIEITLERAWNSLVWSDKLRLVISLFRGISSSSLQISTSNLKDTDIDGGPFQLFEHLSKSYPSLLQPLMYERDTYLAWSLKRSKAVNNSKQVVGVIGRGHMNGVVYSLISDQGNLRFRDLAGNKADLGSNGWVSSVLKGLVRDIILSFILWAFYEQIKDKVPFAGLF